MPLDGILEHVTRKRAITCKMSYRKNATTLVIRPKKARARNANAMRPKRFETFVRSRNQNMLFTGNTTSEIEKKAVDTAFTHSNPLTASFGTAAVLNPLSLGTAANGQRVGRKIQMRSVQIRYIVTPPGAGGVSQNRFVLVYDKQTNGATPIATDVFTINSFHSPLNLNNAERFVVIFDEITDSCQSQLLNIAGKRYAKIRLDTVYTGNTGTVSDILSGGLFLFCANNSDPAVGNASTSYSYSRVRYTDA